MSLLKDYQSLKQHQQESSEEHLINFVKAGWHVLEPSKPFKSNWHIRAECEHIEAVYKGQINRLIINVPPGSCKSTIASHMGPVWAWLSKPEIRFLTGSHNLSIATRDAMKSRDLIRSPWFQDLWGDKFHLKKDQDQKTRYENNKTGYRSAFGVLTGVTGDKGDIVTLDDPHSALDGMFSDVSRKKALDIFDQQIFTRLNDFKKSAIIVIMQRLHNEDLTGHILGTSKHGEWEHLMLPMEFDSGRRCRTSINFVDPRMEEGELLWPKFFSKPVVNNLKKRLGVFGAAGQLQQTPVPMSGGVMDIAWFQRYEKLPPKEEWLEKIQVWDTASKANITNAFWVGGTWIRTKSKIYLVDIFRKQMNYPEGKKAVLAQWLLHQPNSVIIEDKSTGQSLIQEIREDNTNNINVFAFEPEADKITRFSIETPAIEAGNVFLPMVAHWVDEYLSELALFPLSSFMDQCDMTSMVLRYIRNKTCKLTSASIGSGGNRLTANQDF